MTTRKRWYQLSMLQLLVAMAVASLFCWINLPKRSVLVVEPETIVVAYTAGWPLTYSNVETMALNYPSSIEVAPAMEWRWQPLLINITIGLMVWGLSLIGVGAAQGRIKQCPFP